MGTANLTAIKDRIAEFAVVPTDVADIAHRGAWSLVADRTRTASALARVEIESAGVASARAVRAADFGPVEYLSKLVGIDTQTAMRWFTVLVACLLDPAAVMLLVAASARGPSA